MYNHYELSKKLSIALFSLSAAFAAPSAQAQTYDLPFLANDLKPGERYYTKTHKTGQFYAFDVSVRRIENGKWYLNKANVSDPDKLSARLAYGKPFYAMEAGTVVACWRSAPENPRNKYDTENSDDIDFEDREWLHPQLRAFRIDGGGNMLYIQHDDGSMMLYAHAQTNSIPAALCPKPDAIFAQGRDPEDKDNWPRDQFGIPTELSVPAGQRATVKKGQFLGKIGSSGQSTGAHIHFHLTAADKVGTSNPGTAPINFARGLTTPLTWDSGYVANFNSWTPLNNGLILPGGSSPSKHILIWPHLKYTHEYARHKFAEDAYQRMFTHLTNSGLYPKWFDAYSVGGKVYFNFVYAKAPGPFRHYFGLTASQHQQRMNQAKADGYSPVQIESYLRGGQVRYASTYLKKSGQWRARHGLSAAQHDDTFNQAKTDGLSPVSVSVVSVNGQRQYTTLYRSNSIGNWQLKSSVSENDYQQVYNDNKAAGRTPIYLNGYMHNGTPYLSAIFANGLGPIAKAHHKMSGSDYQTKYNDAYGKTHPTRTVTAFDGASSLHRYAAVWTKPQRVGAPTVQTQVVVPSGSLTTNTQSSNPDDQQALPSQPSRDKSFNRRRRSPN